MIRIRTPSRLHFGLFALASEQAGPWLNQEGQATIARRSFGGVGLMVDRPGIDLTLAEATTWSAHGPLAERALHFAQAYCRVVNLDQAFAVRVVSAAPEHAGLGTGTQLGLAVARAIAGLTNQPEVDAVTLARRVGRGLRSALSIHGFDQGGFLVEAGKFADTAVAPLLFCREFPSDWHILLVTPRDLQGTHGLREIDAFAALGTRPPDDRTTEALCRLVLLGLLPALSENDRRTFGEALYDFNRRSGALFHAVQGGHYAHPRIEAIIAAIREFGVKGVGQSSWGPTVFAFVSPQETPELCQWLMAKHGITSDDMIVTSARNRGANVSIS